MRQRFGRKLVAQCDLQRQEGADRADQDCRKVTKLRGMLIRVFGYSYLVVAQQDSLSQVLLLSCLKNLPTKRYGWGNNSGGPKKRAPSNNAGALKIEDTSKGPKRGVPGVMPSSSATVVKSAPLVIRR